MKYIKWKGHLIIPATVIMPEDATYKEVCEELAFLIDEASVDYIPVHWDDIEGVEEIEKNLDEDGNPL